MRKLIALLSTLCFCVVSNAQSLGNPNGTIRILGKLQTDGNVFLPSYLTADTNKVLGVDGNGMLTLRSKISGNYYTKTQTDSLVDTTFSLLSDAQAEAIALASTLLEDNPIDSVWFVTDSIRFRHLDGSTTSIYHPVTTQVALDDSAAAIRAAGITNIRRKVGTDSVQYYKNGVWVYAFKDSTGAGGGGSQDLQSVLNNGSSAINNSGSILIDDKAGTTNTFQLKGTHVSSGASLVMTPISMYYDFGIALNGASHFDQIALGAQSVEVYSDFFNTGKTTIQRSGSSTNYAMNLPSATGTVVLEDNTATLSNKTLSSPALTGTPTAPTPSAGDSTTKVATSAFVTRALASIHLADTSAMLRTLINGKANTNHTHAASDITSGTFNHTRINLTDDYGWTGLHTWSQLGTFNAGLIINQGYFNNGALYEAGWLDLAQVTSNVDDYSGPGTSGGMSQYTHFRIYSDAARDITGLNATSATFAFVYAGKILSFHNVGSFNITWKDNNSSSTAANRFHFPSGDVVQKPNEVISFIYDNVNSYWAVIGKQGGGGGTTYTFSAPLSEAGGTVDIADAAADGTTKGVASFGSSDFNASSGNITLDYTNAQAADATHKGFLTSSDWSTFNTAYSDRLKWDGGSTGLVAATGRLSLGLGTLATQSGTFSGTSSGINTGDQTISITGDVTALGSTAALTATVTKINGTSLAGLATGILKNTTTSGVPSIAVAADFPTLNQNTTGTASNVTGTVAVANGGTGITSLGTGIATWWATPSSANLRAALTDEVGTGAAYFVGGALGTPASGTATNLTGLPLTTGVTGILPVANGGTGSATPGIVAGIGISVTGTWPNQTVTNSGAGGSFDHLSTLVNSVVSITGTTTLNSAAFGVVHLVSGTTSDYTINLPAVSGNAGKFIEFLMSGALTKMITLDGNASETIDGSLTRIMWASESAVLYCDGTTWTKVSGKSIPMSCSMSCSTATSISSATVTLVPLNTSLTDNTGVMADATNNRINIKRGGQYDIVASITLCGASNGLSGIPAQSTNTQTRINKNGSFLTNVAVTSASGSFPATRIAAQATVSTGDNLDIRAYQTTGNGCFLYNLGSPQETQMFVTERITW